ncbi:hypothetical protein G6F23_015563 [Rhizopus arrhizus]|nr:hypothetical protein G6F23_015563 [Rhizopus arrhizus]
MEVGAAQAAVCFIGQERAHVHVLHLLAHVDVEPVHRQVQADRRRPDEAGAPRRAGFRIQLAVAGAAADQLYRSSALVSSLPGPANT